MLALVAGIVLTGCSERQTTAGSIPATTVPAQPGLIPAGTTLPIRTEQSIDTDHATAGQTHAAEVTSDVMDATGRVAIPRGSRATLAVTEVSTGGAVSSPELQLTLQSVTVGGRTYPVFTPGVERTADRSGLGANRRTATMVGGGAALGTIIGAIAGGGSGALAGAAIGAGAGAVTQVLTKGDRVRVPAETVLNFRLDQPIQLEGYQY
jgi:hypothetical protein